MAPFDSGAYTDIGDPDGTWSPWFGHGRVDAPTSIAEALRRLGAPGTPTQVRVRSAPNQAIPDNDRAGVTRTLQLPGGRTIREIAVGVDRTHPWIGDLAVTLKSPSDTSAILQNRTGGSTDNIIHEWKSTDTPTLQGLRGGDSGGAWQLQVADLARQDEGKLNRWHIRIIS